jgi:tetratricopeptide (TPR) repeat protein
MMNGRMRQRYAGLLAAATLLTAFPEVSRAENPEKFLALFFDGMRNRDYPKAMTGFLEIVALEPTKPAEGQSECFAALKTGEVARAEAPCNHFAEVSGDDPRAHIGLALVDVIAERPLEAVKSLDAALKIDPRNLPANLLRRELAAGGAGAVGGGWAVPDGEATATLASGFRQFESGDFKAAAASFDALFEAGQVHGNVPLMLFIARKRAGLPTGDELEPMLDLGGARYKMLISALRAEITPKEALNTYLQSWGEGNDYAANRFFLGQAAMIQGDKTQAKRYFTRAAAVKEEGLEVRLAKAELKRLE